MAHATAKPLPRVSRIRTAFKTVADRLGPRLGLGLLAAVIVLILFGVLADEVREGEAQPFDDAVRAGRPRRVVAERDRRASRDHPARLAAVPHPDDDRLRRSSFLHLRRIRGAILLTVTMVGVTLLNWILKVFFQRARPEAFFGLTTPDLVQLPERALPGLVLLLRRAGRAGHGAPPLARPARRGLGGARR